MLSRGICKLSIILSFAHRPPVKIPSTFSTHLSTIRWTSSEGIKFEGNSGRIVTKVVIPIL